MDCCGPVLVHLEKIKAKPLEYTRVLRSSIVRSLLVDAFWRLGFVLRFFPDYIDWCGKHKIAAAPHWVARLVDAFSGLM